MILDNLSDEGYIYFNLGIYAKHAAKNTKVSDVFKSDIKKETSNISEKLLDIIECYENRLYRSEYMEYFIQLDLLIMKYSLC